MTHALLGVLLHFILWQPANRQQDASLTPFTTPGDTVETAAEAWQSCYDSARLQHYGLAPQVFRQACAGYNKMKQKGLINRPGMITICDFSKSSGQKRLYIIDLGKKKLLLHTLVAHGQGSGDEFARRFSNTFNSHQSSLGFYTTGSTYFGEHGYSLKLQGREAGFNDNALARDVVMHPADYVSEPYVRANRKAGRSWGCPAVPPQQHEKIINLIKNGTCLFVYHPTTTYLKRSKLLN